MIPLRDTVPSQRTPVVNYAIMATCTLVFFCQLTQGSTAPELVEKFAFIPARYRFLTAMQPFNFEWRYLPFFSAMFMHGGWLHFLGNMLYLWIFGDNVEDRFGKLLYLIFFLATGFFAFYAHYFFYPNSPVPVLGASGAIAGVMGAYFLMFKESRIVTLIPIFVFVQVVEIPAVAFLIFWFLMQLLSGTNSWLSGISGGVAWWAHVGGFLAGYFIAKWVNRGSEFRRG